MTDWRTLSFAALGLAILCASVPSAFAEDNKQIATRFAQAFAAGDATTLKQIVAENVVDHSSPPSSRPGQEGLLDAVALYRTWFPDIKITVEQQVSEGDFVTQYGKVSGINDGAMMGIPATHKAATFAYIDMYRFAGGRIVETWHVEDIAGMLAQLGLLRQ